MTDTIDTMIDRTIGGIRLTVRTVADYDPDLSWLGRYVDRAKRDRSVPLYSRETGGILMPSSDQWRDERGRIMREPAEYGIGREYRFIELTDAADSLASAVSDARRLESYERGDWGMIGIVAMVYVNGREIGNDSLWGIESDSGRDYLRSVARDVSSEAIAETRACLARLAQAAAS